MKLYLIALSAVLAVTFASAQQEEDFFPTQSQLRGSEKIDGVDFGDVIFDFAQENDYYLEEEELEALYDAEDVEFYQEEEEEYSDEMEEEYNQAHRHLAACKVCRNNRQCSGGEVCQPGQRIISSGSSSCSVPFKQRKKKFCAPSSGTPARRPGRKPPAGNGQAAECSRCVPNSRNPKWQCASGLQCPRRPANRNPTVTGCADNPGFTSTPGHSYCIAKGAGKTDLPACTKGCRRTSQCADGLVCKSFRQTDTIPGCGSGSDLGLPARRAMGVCYDRTTQAPSSSPTSAPTKNTSIVRYATEPWHRHKNQDGMKCRNNHQCHPGSNCDPAEQRCRKAKKNELVFVASRNGADRRFSDGYHTGKGKEVLDGVGNLEHCEGDCNTDWDCAWGHVCIKRQGGMSMKRYGCSGLGTIGEDYCVSVKAKYFAKQDLETLVLWRNDGEQKNVGGDGSNDQLDACEGDCDKDADCRGQLICYFRDYQDHLTPGVPADQIVGADAPMSFTNAQGKKFGCQTAKPDQKPPNDVDYCISKNWLAPLKEEAKKGVSSGRL